jgi:hypothetical protein
LEGRHYTVSIGSLLLYPLLVLFRVLVDELADAFQAKQSVNEKKFPGKVALLESQSTKNRDKIREERIIKK